VYQLAKFIDPKLSVFQKLVWVEGEPEHWETKYSVGIEQHIETGPTEGVGFATNIIGDEDNIRMVAYLNQLELQAVFAKRVGFVLFSVWRDWPAWRVEDMAKE
jgi:hypothetical protein